MSKGERDLDRLLENLSPVLLPDSYVYVSLPGEYADFSELDPLGSFREEEGWSLIVRESTAAGRGLRYEGSFRVITLTVHSSLEAIGLTAAVAAALASAGISANIVAACFHDHLLVPAAAAEESFAVLDSLSARYKQDRFR